MTDFPEKEEHYLLRIQDQTAAKKLRDLLNQSSAPTTPPLELKFDSKSLYYQKGSLRLPESSKALIH